MFLTYSFLNKVFNLDLFISGAYSIKESVKQEFLQWLKF